MNANLPAKSSPEEIMETVLIKGDLSKLTTDERTSYYKAVCDSIGLNALTKPFDYIILNGKMQLYALKACTDQLRSIYDISVTSLTKEDIQGVHVVTANVQNGKGRTDADIGAVNIASLKGDNLANAMMKAATKAKRRATLSICGLGMLDETEIETIPGAVRPTQNRVPSPSEAVEEPAQQQNTKPKHQKPRAIVPEQNDTFELWGNRYIAAFSGSKSLAELTEWDTMNDKSLAMIQQSRKPDAQAIYDRIMTKHEDLCNKFRRESISPGTASKVPPADTKPTRPTVYPNPAMDPEGFLEAAEKRMAAINDPEELARVWEEEIDPASEGIFKPDYELLQSTLGRHEKRLGAD